MSIRKTELGDQHEKVADVLISIGDILDAQEEYGEAKQRYGEGSHPVASEMVKPTFKLTKTIHRNSSQHSESYFRRQR